MCQSKAEGGRRCYAHLSAAHSRAVAELAEADAKVSELITAQSAVLRVNGGRLTGPPDATARDETAQLNALARYRRLETQLKPWMRKQRDAIEKEEASRALLMETDRGYQEALDEADAIDAASRSLTDVHERRSARNRAARLRLAAEKAHGNAQPARRKTGPGARVGEPSDVSDMVAFMREAGYTHFVIFDGERVTRDNIIPARGEDELNTMLRACSTKGAARLRRDDGTWPGPQPPLPLTEAPRTPPIVR